MLDRDCVISTVSELSESSQSCRFAMISLGLGGVIVDLSFAKVNWTHYRAIACETSLFNATILSKLWVAAYYVSCQGPRQLFAASQWSTWTARWQRRPRAGLASIAKWSNHWLALIRAGNSRLSSP
jgi:hypothetical protein